MKRIPIKTQGFRTTGKHKGEKHWLEHLNETKQIHRKQIASLAKLYRKPKQEK